MEALTAIILIGNILISIDAVRLFGIRRLSFALLLSIGVLICFYNLLFNLLGIFNLITFYSVLSFEILLLSLYFFYRKRAVKLILSEFAELFKTYRTYLFAILSLLVLVLMSALLLPPNNQDSMSYHLARVVHWMQNQNIGYYFTSVDRQNRMGPGAEILILLLQLLSFSDKLANLVQYLAFLFFCVSLPDVLRAIGIRKRNVLFLSVFTISTPMLLLQASTTQNDILSAILTWSIIIVLIHLYKTKIEYTPYGLFALTGIFFAAAYLVKPTSILILLPLIAWMGTAYLFKYKSSLKGSLTKIAVALTIFVISIGPDMYRKLAYADNQGVSFDDVFYPVSKEWNPSRFFNILLAGMHHSPFTYSTNENIISQASITLGAQYDRDSIKTNWNFYPHEDYIGNPLHFIVFVILTISGLILLLIFPFKTRYLLALFPLTAFLILALFIKDNPWISRLQLPFFLVVPMCFIPLERIRSDFFQLSYRVVFTLFAFICLAIGLLIVSQNAIRPLTFAAILNPLNSFGDFSNLYYQANKDLKTEHDHIINICVSNNLKTVGVLAGPGFHEYPLSWQLYKNGVRLLHIDPKHLPFVDVIYNENETSLDIGDRYIKVNEKLYMRAKPIMTLSEANNLELSLLSLFIPDHGTISDNGVLLYGNGSIRTPFIFFENGEYILTIKSSGVDVDGQGSHLNVFMGNNKIGDIYSLKPGQIDSLYFQIPNQGQHQLRIDFDNDIYDPARGFDRNALIQEIIISKDNK